MLIVVGAVLLVYFAAWAYCHTCEANSSVVETLHRLGKPLMRVDIGKAKVIWVATNILSTVPSTVEIAFPEPMNTLLYLYSFSEVSWPDARR